jgi:hypothetical protein
VRVLGGNFLGFGPGDVLAIGFNSTSAQVEIQFWLLPAVARSDGTPILLTGGLPAEALALAPDLSSFRMATAVADVDRDGRDEAIVAVPAQDEEHCELLVYGIDPERLELRSSALVAEPCVRLDLATVDVDADGHVDLLWNSGRADGNDRLLSVFWNDGTGVFSSEARTVLVDRARSPQAFAALPANTLRGLSIAYATPFGVELVPVDAATRLPGEMVPLLELPGSTGLTAADLNGDGATDLVAAARGNLSVLKAALEAL